MTELPSAMRHMGWITSARMMERWFASPAYVMPADRSKRPSIQQASQQQIDESIISMRWASQFQRCRDAIDLARAQSFHTPAGMRRLRELLLADGWNGKGLHSFGHYGMSAKQMEKKCQVNFVELGGVTDTLDDMYGALGEATLKVGIVGTGSSDGGQHRFHVDYLGFYLVDTYDFNGHQYLGTWTDKRVLTKGETLGAGTYIGRRIYKARDDSPIAFITNGDFRDYRATSGRGGDFLVISDIKWERSGVTIDLGALV
ncbi:DUF6402 family protein [Lysobacter soli]|uniref:DUF6402 family protein n=1 Tax=Lysobacter soli TaxID=453783 RepID=UPI00209D1007|nr:DUF6402 family protein [Lysobacter soli]UTA52742.1 DUF6402 family protein [Lysobacter soli]